MKLNELQAMGNELSAIMKAMGGNKVKKYSAS